MRRCLDSAARAAGARGASGGVGFGVVGVVIPEFATQISGTQSGEDCALRH